MSPDIDPVWHGATRINIGKALLSDGGEGMTAGQLEAVLGQPHQSNLKKAAEQMVVAGALEAVAAPSPDGSQGRPAQTAFTFAAGERERFEALLERLDDPAELQAGTPLVFVDAEHNRGDLMKLLSLPGVLSASARARELEGDNPQIMVSFSGPAAVEESREFFELLGEAELKAQLRFIAKARSSGEMRKVARRRRQKAERVREQLKSMQTAPRPE